MSLVKPAGVAEALGWKLIFAVSGGVGSAAAAGIAPITTARGTVSNRLNNKTMILSAVLRTRRSLRMTVVLNEAPRGRADGNSFTRDVSAKSRLCETCVASLLKGVLALELPNANYLTHWGFRRPQDFAPNINPLSPPAARYRPRPPELARELLTNNRSRDRVAVVQAARCRRIEITNG